MNPTTRWSLVVAAKAANPAGRRALGELCEVYWRPLYVFARRRGLDAEAARDGVQGFLAELLAGVGVGGAQPSRGRFRNYLLGAFRHFLRDEHARRGALKRGEHLATVSLDADLEASLAAQLGESTSDPEAAFERSWAATLLQQAATRLRHDYRARNREALFDAVAPFLTQATEANAVTRAAAASVGLSENAFKVAVHRARRRFGAVCRDEVEQTLDRPDEAAIHQELAGLAAVLADSQVDV